MTMPAVEPPQAFEHVTVMLREVVQAIAPRPQAVYLDLTAGGGGHSAGLLDAAPGARVIAIDRDLLAVAAAQERLRPYGDRVSVVHASFADVSSVLAAQGVARVDGVIADLGVSSPQLDTASRGMSFRQTGPLDMRMDTTRGETALELLERLSQDELANVIYQYGEERRSRRVARCIKQALEVGELQTTTDLRRAIVRAVGPRRVAGVDPATRTFQALRLAVNQEIGELGRVLEVLPGIVAEGGVAAFISFHSLEDRLVKRAFLDREVWQRLTKKPQVVGADEREGNPRSRSAKLRAARRVPIPASFDAEPVEGIDGAS